MFLLRTGKSLDIKTDSFFKSVKPLLSRHYTRCHVFAVKADLKLQMVCILTFFLLNMIYHCAHWILRNSLGITSLKRKREKILFLNLRIFLILLFGNEFLKPVLNFCFKLDDNVPSYESTIKRSFLGTVGITFFGT